MRPLAKPAASRCAGFCFLSVLQRDGVCARMLSCVLYPQSHVAWLQDLFSTAGTVTDVKLVKDKATGQSAGSAFVKFEEHHAAAVALQTINGQCVYGKVR